MVLRIVAGPAGDDGFDSRKRAFKGDSGAASADAPPQRTQGAFAPAHALGNLAAWPGGLPQLAAFGCQRREQGDCRPSVLGKKLVRYGQRFANVAFDERAGILVGFRVYNRQRFVL